MSSTDVFKSVLECAFAHALSHLAGADTRPVCATADLEQLRERFARPLPQAGTDPVTVINDLVWDADGGIVGSAGGRFFAWVIGGTLPAALAADWLTAVWDQNAAIHACGPAEAVIEEVAGGWLKELFGLPQTASFAFVTGTQLAHLTCLGAARHRLLKRAGWDVEEQGFAGAPAIRIVTSSERHGSIERAIRILGLVSGPSRHCRATIRVSSNQAHSSSRWNVAGDNPPLSCCRPVTSTSARSIALPI